MKPGQATADLENRATEALKGILEQLSAVKLKGIQRQAPAHRHAILVQVDVYGHSHTLSCEVNSDTHPSKVRTSLKKLQDYAAHVAGRATPVLIAPHLSPEAQALCKEGHISFLDLEGNARLTLGEVFIAKRTVVGRSCIPSRIQCDLHSACERRLPVTKVAVT
jgi:hypothetical protein